MLVVSLEGGFPLSRNFSMGTHVKCTRVNEIEAKYERPRVNVKVERGSTFTFTRDLPYTVFVLFTRVTLRAYLRQWKSTLGTFRTESQYYCALRNIYTNQVPSPISLS